MDLHPPPLFMRELSFSAQRWPWLRLAEHKPAHWRAGLSPG
ncbi:hypothetical protein HMPREF1978_00666 [Actinomyces graevenitzii F0530]|uniref:Uncharacterized protein n=1 Tax=Actinomyces graevenitzii F0530 TaxID=1321817 RepID=U1Q532_9ACTO|nr:hypothetical protein HMPREF1978_00666 [Actinomyces graevenitzii F0530]